MEYDIFYINLKERTDRKEEIEKEFGKLENKKYKFNIKKIDAIKKGNGALGAAESHIKALKLAKELNLNQVIIAEDDLIIKEELVNKYFDIIHNFEKEWDVIILSGWFYSFFNETKTSIDNNLVKCSSTQSCTWYLIKKNYYDSLIDCFTESKRNLKNKTLKKKRRSKNKTRKKKKKTLWTIDQNWKKLQKKDNWYRFNVNLGYQRASYSDIENKFVDYTNILY